MGWTTVFFWEYFGSLSSVSIVLLLATAVVSRRQVRPAQKLNTSGASSLSDTTCFLLMS